jgi:histidyl-tRNA synthetase
MKYKAVRGMEDILSADVKVWQWIESTARKFLESYGYEEIRTPILEETPVFTRSIGETTDIVTKEMYTFTDRKERSLTLRPEGTAPIVRAYIEHALDKASSEVKLYYLGPMFRSERPQKGRSRQFHQIGAEVFGSRSPYADAELITQLSSMLKVLGLNDFTIKLNSLGCRADKEKFADKLKKYLEKEKARLCDDCRERVKKNVLRVLDCKNESCVQLVKKAPDILESLCVPCKDHFDRLKDTLKAVKVSFTETKNLVRGLDYYTGTVFEITHPALGGQDAMAAGGRYDNLVKDMGGSDTGAVGYAIGMERIIIAIKKELPAKGPNVLYIATLGDAAKFHGIWMAENIRREFPDLIALTDTKEASLKAQMRNADRWGSRIVLILGEDELKNGKVLLRDMATKEQRPVDKDSIVEELRKVFRNA